MAGSPVMSTAITVDEGINSRCSAAPGAGINKKEGGRDGERVVLTPGPPTGTSPPPGTAIRPGVWLFRVRLCYLT